MRKVFFLFLLLVFALLCAAPSFADSPVTSTDFYSAYLDLDIVQKAANDKTVDLEIANYLAEASNPIDVKAAVINALGWDVAGKENTEIYSQMVYDKSVQGLNLDSLTADELFCIGYLMAMDDYFNTEQAAIILKKADSLKSDSFTIAIVSAIVDTQKILEHPENWGNVWLATDMVLKDKQLKQDMRADAEKIIVDYMSLYSNEPVSEPLTTAKTLTLQIGSPYFLVNSKEYELDPGRGTNPELRNSRTFLPISPVVKEIGGQTSWDGKEQKVTIELESKKIELWIGKTTAYVNGAPKKMDAAPYVSNARTMLPLRFIIENLGFDVEWDGIKSEVKITV